jgi:hypothetical protein
MNSDSLLWPRYLPLLGVSGLFLFLSVGYWTKDFVLAGYDANTTPTSYPSVAISPEATPGLLLAKAFGSGTYCRERMALNDPGLRQPVLPSELIPHFRE